MWNQNEIAKARAIIAEQERQRAAQAYADQKAAVDNKYDGGLGGFLGGIVGGIGKGIGDIAKGTFGVIGGGAAGIKDLIEGKAGTQENQNAFKRWLYDAETDKDASAKAAGTALNAATTLATTALPGLGAGTAASKALGGTIANTAAGAIGGVADEFQQQGADARFDSALNRAISGAAAGAVTGGLNKKIGNATGNLSSKLLNNKIATSTIGRGALSGAVGGATGAGTSAALGGGDIASAALQGGLSGAVSGGAQAGVMNVGRNIGINARNKVSKAVTGKDWQTSTTPIVATKAQTEQVATADVTPTRKQQQFDLIQEKNPMTDDYHTGIRKVEDIMTFKEALNSPDAGNEYYTYPDWTQDNAAAAANKGTVTVYSSYPIEEGTFVSPSKMMAQDYAGGGQIYSKEIPLDDVAWVNGDEGNYAPIKQTSAKTPELDIPDYTKPTDYQGNEIKITKKNIGQKLGDSLALTGERIENADLYNSLYSKTASDIVKNDTVNKLRKLGYTPENYKEAAKISTTTNKFVDDIVKNSGATIVDNGLVDRIAQPSAENAINTPTYQKVYESTVKGVLDKIEKGSIPGKYNASDLLAASRDVNKIANKYLKKATNVNGGDLATDAGALADALFDVKRELRNLATTSVDGFGDNYTKTQLSQRLKNLGATDAAVADMMEAKNIGEFIAKTAKYEDARQMAYEMDSNLYRRNAISGSKSNTNPVNRVLQDSGAGELLSVATKPIGKLVGKGARIAGNAISGVSEALATPSYGSVQPLSQDAQFLLGNFIGRTEGQNASGNMVQNARKAEDYQNLESMLAEMQGGSEGLPMAQNGNIMGGYPQVDMSPVLDQMNQIQNAMSNAMAAGDIKAYSQLADMYKDAYAVYQAQAKMNDTGTEGSSLTTAEKNQIAKLQSAGTALDQLESLYQKAGGGQGVIGGNIANFLGGLGLNSDVNTYNQLAQGLINQIGAAIGKTDSLNTEGEVQRALSLVPKITDDNQTAMNKLSTLRQLLQQNTNSYNQLYGA